MRDTGSKDLRKAEREGKQIDLVPLFLELLKKLWLMILVGVILGCLVYGATKVLVKPIYRSSFTAYVNNQQQQNAKDTLSSSDLKAAQELVHTYEYIIKSNTILTAAADQLGLDESYASLKKKVSTQIQNDTEIVSVYVDSTNPEYAYDLATAIAKVAPKYMANIVEGSSMKIIDYPEMPKSRYKPNYIIFALLGGLFGALIIAVITIVRYMTDDKVKTEGEIEERYSIPVLGVIPDISLISKSSSSRYEYRYGGNTVGANQKEGRKDRNEKK